jgi:hypothetical protein
MGHGPPARANGSSKLVGFLRDAERVLTLLLVPATVLAQPTGTIRGVVRDSLGGLVTSAHVTLKGSTMATTSDSVGTFRLSGVTPGDAVLEVRRLGYRPAVALVRISAGSDVEADVRLAPVPEQLAPVEIRRRAEVYDSRLAGFNARRLKHVGYFVTREKLDRMSSARFVDAIRDLPGVSMRTLRGGVVTVSLRGSRCAPMFYIDGFPAISGPMDLDMIDLSGVEGIEVYAGMSSIPAEFMSVVGGESCGVIAVWSRPTKPKRRITQEGQVDLEKLVESRAAYTSSQVDDPAELTSGSAMPVYPDSLWRLRVPGRVVAEFVVDTEGLIESGSLRIVTATDPSFASAVTASLRDAKFRAAVLGGKTVRQIVELPFLFSPAATDSLPPPSN